jgi:hypothetical protein
MIAHNAVDMRIMMNAASNGLRRILLKPRQPCFMLNSNVEEVVEEALGDIEANAAAQAQ